MNWQELRKPIAISGALSNGKIVSLYQWCRHVLIDSATRTFFGPSIYDVAPKLLEGYYVFDGEGWELPYKYPEFAAKAMYASKAAGEEAFRKWLAPQKRRGRNLRGSSTVSN